MTKITVSASRSYEVLIAPGLLSQVGILAKDCIAPCRAMLVSDDNVFSLYGAKVRAALEDAGFTVCNFVFPHGEAHKNLQTYGELLNALCNQHFTRSDVIFALGGGVTGDLSGFAAATYLRGIRYVQLPTSLLAMVDSSVGGKTAIDLDGGKNQAGCFYQPSLVLCDTDALSTLPENEYQCGCAEIIKYAILGSEALFSQLEQTPVRQQAEAVIAACVSMKRDIVQADEYDRGCRQKLNLGHTIGHAIEACSNFSQLHGQAVAAGMGIMLRASVNMGYCDAESARRALALLMKYDLPVKTDFSAEKLYKAALSDKKMDGGTLHLIVPEGIGSCRILDIPAPTLRQWIMAGAI